MMKKYCSVAILGIVILLLSLSSFAAPKDILSNKNTLSTKTQFTLTITRPDDSFESTFKQSYVICANTEKKDVRVKVLIFDEDLGKYVPFEDVNGKSMWDIGSSGIFMKEFQLSRGANIIRVVAYNKYLDENEFVLGENLQLSNFTVTLLDDSVKQSIKTGVGSFTEYLKSLFKK